MLRRFHLYICGTFLYNEDFLIFVAYYIYK